MHFLFVVSSLKNATLKNFLSFFDICFCCFLFCHFDLWNTNVYVLNTFMLTKKKYVTVSQDVRNMRRLYEFDVEYIHIMIPIID